MGSKHDAPTWASGEDSGSSNSNGKAGDKSSKTVAGKVKAAASEGFVKAKAAALVGAHKVKAGTTTGIKWVKEQYHKRASKWADIMCDRISSVLLVKLMLIH